jgi:hypothetical protein
MSMTMTMSSVTPILLTNHAPGESWYADPLLLSDAVDKKTVGARREIIATTTPSRLSNIERLCMARV